MRQKTLNLNNSARIMLIEPKYYNLIETSTIVEISILGHLHDSLVFINYEFQSKAFKNVCTLRKIAIILLNSETKIKCLTINYYMSSELNFLHIEEVCFFILSARVKVYVWISPENTIIAGPGIPGQRGQIVD